MHSSAFVARTRAINGNNRRTHYLNERQRSLSRASSYSENYYYALKTTKTLGNELNSRLLNKRERTGNMNTQSISERLRNYERVMRSNRASTTFTCLSSVRFQHSRQDDADDWNRTENNTDLKGPAEKNSAPIIPTAKSLQAKKKDSFVQFFREALPYITMHKQSLFVIHIPGNVMYDKNSQVFKSVMQDIIILRELGVKLVLVLGSDSQISKLTKLKGSEPKFATSKFGATRRITDEFGLEAAMEACGRNNIAVQAQLTKGPDVRLTRKHGDHYSDTSGWGNSNGSSRNLPVATSGNYVYAKRRGVVDGVDYGLTGEVVKIDKTSILETLEQGDVVLLSSLGFNAAGEVFNCVSRDIAVAAAIELSADKFIVLPEDGYLPKDKSYFTLPDAKKWMIENFARKDVEYSNLVQNHQAYAWLRNGGGGNATNNSNNSNKNGQQQQKVASTSSSKNNNGSEQQPINNNQKDKVNSWQRAMEMDFEWRVPSCPIEMCAATFACHCGVKRVHMVDPNTSGSLLVELFTSDGEGCMVAGDRYEGTRKATIYDCVGIHDMLQPLADAGIVVYRTEDQLRRDILSQNVSFFVIERDGNIIACASFTGYENGKSCEIGSFAVASEYRNEGRGDALLSYLEEYAAENGCERLFLLTTRTAEWFISRGFIFDGVAEDRSELIPNGKKVVPGRGSLLFSKTL
jgi:amino-acid N-acetyltransferase